MNHKKVVKLLIELATELSDDETTVYGRDILHYLVGQIISEEELGELYHVINADSF